MIYLECFLNDVPSHSPGAIHEHYLLKHIPHLGYQVPEGTHTHTHTHTHDSNTEPVQSVTPTHMCTVEA